MHYISADIEGCSGFRSGTEKERCDDLLGAHMTAAAEGLQQGGADRVKITSFHGFPTGLPGFIETVTERGTGEFDLPGLEPDCAGLVMLGFHGPGPEYAHGHAYRFEHLVLNGEKCGEVAVQIMLAASLGVPTALVAGDEGAVAEAQRWAPDASALTIRPGLQADEGTMDGAVLDEIRAACRDCAARPGKYELPPVPGAFRLGIPFRDGAPASIASKLSYPVERRGLVVSRQSESFGDVYEFLLDSFRCCNEARGL